MNTVSIIGNVVRDPELRATTGGTSVCQLSIAVNERRKGGEEYASFVDVDTFGTLADNCALYLRKGRQVAITGRLRQERWQKDGENRSKVKIVAHDVQFLGSRDGAEKQPDALDKAKAFMGGIGPVTHGAGSPPDEDDIPF